MTAFVEIDHVDKVFPLPGGDRYIALANINLTIKEGEFVTLIGHSGCGKSTLLNIVAGLDNATTGGVVLEGSVITQPGPDRMVVFQNYSLLPWKTVRQNIALGVNAAMKHLPVADRHALIEQHIKLVGLEHAADKRPHELSGGMKQRVAIARALAIRPKVMLLDEPFGALDALTRGGLQEQLMHIAEQTGMTCLMVTHDIDEALILSDRVVMLTNGPEAHIGQILDVKIPRPRTRMEVVNHPSYYALRSEMIYFLNQQKRAKKRKGKPLGAVAGNGLEKVNLEIGFSPVTDCAPLVIAKEKGFFEKHGLTQVTLSREPSWKAIADGITNRRLDAAQMAVGMPLAMTLGCDGNLPIPMVSGLILSRNGNAITLDKRFYDQGVRSLADFKARSPKPRQIYTLGIVHPASMHNLMLRYWLASAGINPDKDVNLVVIPPAQMVSNLLSGNIDGFCAGEPWNSRAISEGHGFVIANDLDIWPGHPEKMLSVREDWDSQYPQTHLALVKALLEACMYCDDPRNREEIAKLLSQPDYIGTNLEYIRPGLVDPYDRGTGELPKTLPRYNQFYIEKSACPSRFEGLWVLTQLARWGITAFPKNWIEILERVRRLDVYSKAARELGLPDQEPDRHPIKLFDGKIFNPDAPIDYLNSLDIHGKIQIEEILIDEILINEPIAAAVKTPA
ncbi:MAG: ABC transporter substrate-binding protein [Leptolyngbyaceae cyanobacterium CSU_1_4]|nr:ABC transporter substrate-binding protein [Leptolyngbyaceae cyanobacterium CSU_1_4]